MQNVQFNLSVEEANLVLMALGEMPAKMSMNLIAKLQQQAQAQQQPESE